MMARTPQADEFGLWPLNIVGRQWRRVMRQKGWRKIAATVTIGVEVLLIVVVLALLVI
jgi:hypothetical protein